MRLTPGSLQTKKKNTALSNVGKHLLWRWLASNYPIISGSSEDIPVLFFDLRVDGVVAKLGAAVRVRVAQGLKWSPDHRSWADNAGEGKVNQLHRGERENGWYAELLMG